MFSLEPLIIARIRTVAPELATVGSRSLVTRAEELGPLLPAAFVIPGAGDFGDITPDAVATFEQQLWEVALCVEHIKDPDDIETTASKAGPILQSILIGLHGWRPGDPQEYQPFGVLPRPEPVYLRDYAEFSLIFETRRRVAGAN